MFYHNFCYDICSSSNRNFGHNTYDDVSLDLQTPAIYFTLNHSNNVSSTSLASHNTKLLY